MQLARLVFRGALLMIFSIALSLTSRNAATESLAGEPPGLFATVVNVMMRALANVRTSVLFGTNYDGMVGGRESRDPSAAQRHGSTTDIALIARGEHTGVHSFSQSHEYVLRSAAADAATRTSVRDAETS